MKKITGIYKITSPSGKVYIGQSWDIISRWNNHGSKKATPKLYYSIKKYGKKNHCFQIIHELPNDADQIVIDCYEQLYIDLYKAANVRLLNVRDGGRGGKIALESRQKMSESRMGRVVSEATRLKISIAHIGKIKPKSKDHIDKVRIANTGKKRPKDAIEATASKKRGKKLNAEQRKRLSDTHIGQVAWNKGIKMSNEFREKMRAASTGKKLTPEAILKREETKRAKGNSGHSGRKFSEEHKKKLSDARRSNFLNK